ncbi:hypothetical protein AUJ61_02180 [Candidatus Pacearchaeota archaeon CG1_02_30_18]|nr:MAG: hypothetical protein AUJ61_02180 [Candidatus Pacearchaeota archaeon CG1_02_30_18]
MENNIYDKVWNSFVELGLAEINHGKIIPTFIQSGMFSGRNSLKQKISVDLPSVHCIYLENQENFEKLVNAFNTIIKYKNSNIKPSYSCFYESNSSPHASLNIESIRLDDEKDVFNFILGYYKVAKELGDEIALENINSKLSCNIDDLELKLKKNQ